MAFLLKLEEKVTVEFVREKNMIDRIFNILTRIAVNASNNLMVKSISIKLNARKDLRSDVLRKKIKFYSP